MIVRKAIQEIRGFRYMAEHLDIRSGLGQKVFYDLPWYGSREEIEGELERVSKTIRAIQEDGRRAEQVAARLGLVKDIRKSVERVKEGVVLDDLELFELKRLALNNGQLQELVKDWGVVCLPDLEGVLEVLDPEGTRIPHFYICDAFSKELAGKKKKRNFFIGRAWSWKTGCEGNCRRLCRLLCRDWNRHCPRLLVWICCRRKHGRHWIWGW